MRLLPLGISGDVRGDDVPDPGSLRWNRPIVHDDLDESLARGRAAVEVLPVRISRIPLDVVRALDRCADLIEPVRHVVVAIKDGVTAF
jgi:hypothetical protein